jgi:hypothetical protein
VSDGALDDDDDDDNDDCDDDDVDGDMNGKHGGDDDHDRCGGGGGDEGEYSVTALVLVGCRLPWPVRVPLSVGRLRRLVELGLEGAGLVGSIPPGLAGLGPGLTSLNMADNALTGVFASCSRSHRERCSFLHGRTVSQVPGSSPVV